MKKYTLKLTIVIVVLVLFVLGVYANKYSKCLKDIIYVPPREQIESGSGFYRVSDKGDYYSFFGRNYKTSDDAVRACIWK